VSCLIELCFVASVYISGGVGIQPSQDNNGVDQLGASNQYGANVGELAATVEFNNGLYIGVRHISGLNTYEPDDGYNAIMVGAKIYFKGK